MNDNEIVEHVHRLTEEEHQIERSHIGSPLTDEEIARRDEIEIALDQCWDLLRQRQARKDAGQNPEESAIRGPEVVEHYQQ